MPSELNEQRRRRLERQVPVDGLMALLGELREFSIRAAPADVPFLRRQARLAGKGLGRRVATHYVRHAALFVAWVDDLTEAEERLLSRRAAKALSDLVSGPERT